MDEDKLIDQLIKHEGLVLFPYKDTAGKLTIGVGHNLTDLGITKVQALSILQDDIKSAMAFIKRNFPWFNELDEVRQRALVDMVFNLGGKILQFKNTLKAMRDHNWNGAADGMLNSLWAQQVGKRAETLAKMIRVGAE